MNPPEQVTPEGLLATFEAADAQHLVYGQYGMAATQLYNVQTGLELDHRPVNGWLALPMQDSMAKTVGIAFLSSFRSEKPRYFPKPFPVGCVVFGTPAKDQPLFIVSDPEAAFAISRTGQPCLLTFTPCDYGGKHSPAPKDCGNMAHVIKAWAGHARLYAPVGCDLAATYQHWLKDHPVKVLPLALPIDQYMDTEALKAELVILVANVVDAETDYLEVAEPAEADITDDLQRLASLSLIDYDRCRTDEAKRFGIRASVLDQVIKPYRMKVEPIDDDKGMFPMVEPWHDPVDGVTLLDELAAIVHRYIVCEKQTINAAALWIVFSWCIDVMQVAPIACITAPEKRCGKTQLLNLIGMLCKKPLPASNITAAALFRSIEAFEPTLLIDEADAFLGQNEELRGIINSGHSRQSAFVIRTVGDNFDPTRFSTWGAKAISGIGQLSDTLKDRSILLVLRRKQPNEKRDRLRHADMQQFEQVKSKLARWVDDNLASLKFARPLLPEALNDRAQDNWEGLLAIADCVGGHWPITARSAAMAISGIEEEAPSINEELLADIKQAFETMKVTRISSVELLERLCSDEEAPWGTWLHGKPMTPRKLSKRLGDFNISPKTLRDVRGTFKGYELADFKDAFSRYLKVKPANTPHEPVTRSQANDSKAFSPNESVTEQSHVTDAIPLEPLQTQGCHRVTDQKWSGSL
jgi:putative DNA primase/helicase